LDFSYFEDYFLSTVTKRGAPGYDIRAAGSQFFGQVGWKESSVMVRYKIMNKIREEMKANAISW
jgi:hypothetical protein